MTFNELIIYSLLKYGICIHAGDQMNEEVPDCQEILKQVKSDYKKLYARFTELEDFTGSSVFTLDVIIIFTEYGTRKKNGRSYDGVFRKMKFIRYDLDGHKMKQSFKTLD